MSNPTNALSIGEIENKLQNIQNAVNDLKTQITNTIIPPSTSAQILNLEINLQSILTTINKISGVDSVLESYINSLVFDMKNQSKKDSFYKINGNNVESTELLKAEINMIKQLSTVYNDIKNKFNKSIGNDSSGDEIKKAITNADNNIIF